MPHCSACGQAVESTAKFCQHCGQAIARSPSRPSDWSEPFGGVGCASTILAACAIVCGIGTAFGLVFAPMALVHKAVEGIAAFLGLLLLAGLTIVFVRVRALGFRDDQPRR